ncbi:glycosyltransferase family 2 protein [Periconia macrospinosa]|uniref:Glycosyltransferase family 2 protein n=1 Tax=Periconia macrospinosa TaxID=97972 RepID=A0A2V1DKG2_9PLEO|nr:glycosyltransferase family 2 protein [Periconia macrospinosa]
MALLLGALWAWDIYEKIAASTYARRYKTVPLPANPSYDANDVSIVVPTIDTESTFTECVRLWLKSNPREIIIVTVPRCRTHVEQLVSPVRTDKITILNAPLANKRQQIALGAKAAKGKVIALVDDDAYWRGAELIPYMLAPFEKAEVGSVAGLQSPEIPSERQNARVITVWEAAAAFDMFKLNLEQPVRFAADGGCWALVGRTMFVRASILQDEKFVDAFTHQVYNNTIVNGADDVYVTEWVLDHGWEICVQNAPEAEITADVKRDWRFALQNLRWERGNFRSFSTRLISKPGFFAFRKRHPYLTRKLVEKLTRPLWTFAYVSAWLKSLWTAPWLAAFFLLWMIFGFEGWVPTYKAFAKEYPYMAGKVWALFCMEKVGPIIDIYAFATMSDDRWLTRAADAQYVKENSDVNKEKIQGVSGRLPKLAPFTRQEIK